MEQKILNNLIEKAIAARDLAYAPYSNFTVGAALLTSNSKIFTGCNIEAASFSATNCAERTAFFKSISEGEKSFEAIAVVGGKKDAQINSYCFPCGVCRQVMAEFCDSENFQVILFDGTQPQIFTLKDIFPYNFCLKDFK